MSLISEALRKARQEALEARDREGSARLMGMMSQPVHRSRFRTASVLAVAIGAACLGAAGAWWGFHSHAPTATAGSAGGGPAVAMAPASTPTPTPTATTPVATPTAAAPPVVTPAARAEKATTEQPTPRPTAAAPASTPSPPTATLVRRESTAEEAGPARVGSGEARPTPGAKKEPLMSVGEVSGERNVVFRKPTTTRPTPTVHRQPRPTATEEPYPTRTPRPREFDITAHVGKVTLELDYLVYRPDDPFAQINGQEVHVGSKIAGFVVEEITQDYVRLRDAHGDLLLRVH